MLWFLDELIQYEQVVIILYFLGIKLSFFIGRIYPFEVYVCLHNGLRNNLFMSFLCATLHVLQFYI